MIDFTNGIRGSLRANLCCRQVSNSKRQGRSEILTIGTSCVMRPCLSLLLVKNHLASAKRAQPGVWRVTPI